MSAPYNLAWGDSVHAVVVAYNRYGDSIASTAGNGALIHTYADAPIDLTEIISARTPLSLSFEWRDGASNGGVSILDYEISYDNAGAVFAVLASNLVQRTFTATGLVYGSMYRFRVRARNAFGLSSYSQELELLFASYPSKVDAPTTTVITNYAIFNWNAPADNGTPITAYRVLIRQGGDTGFVEDKTLCDGTKFLVIQDTQCVVQLSHLSALPFQLLLGAEIQIKVMATNAYGDSVISDVGNGAIMVHVPDAPINLQDDPLTTSDSVIRFIWSDGVSDGY